MSLKIQSNKVNRSFFYYYIFIFVHFQLLRNGNNNFTKLIMRVFSLFHFIHFQYMPKENDFLSRSYFNINGGIVKNLMQIRYSFIVHKNTVSLQFKVDKKKSLHSMLQKFVRSITADQRE